MPQLLRLVQLPIRALSLRGAHRTSTIGAEGGSCGGPTKLPPCPPCGPQPSPPCRPPTTHEPTAVRVVCCPPRRAPPPPCDPARDTRTCSDITHKSVATPISPDCIAQRLQQAKLLRQLDYEREVKNRNEKPSHKDVPPVPYHIGGSREIAAATDGRMYALPRIDSKAFRCSEDGSPPPPLTTKMEKHDHTCYIRDQYHLNPCAHQPRIFIEIDRGNSSKTDLSTNPTLAVSKKIPTTSSSKKPSCSTSCQRPAKDSGPRVGDTGWCKNPLPSSNTSQRCRPLTIVERLRGSKSSKTKTRTPGSYDKRGLHTSVSSFSGLPEMLRMKEGLNEAGRGRVASDEGCVPRKPQQPCPAGELELCVPPGTTQIQVRVYLKKPDEGCPKPPPPASCNNQDSSENNSSKESPCKSNDKPAWQAIKNIQKKFSASSAKACDDICPGNKGTPKVTPSASCPQTEITPKCPRPSTKPNVVCPPNKSPKRCSSTFSLLTVASPYMKY